MAKIHGHGGVLKVGGVDVGHLQGWNLDVQANVTEGYSMGDGWSDNEATVKKWSGSAEVYFDPADAGQNALVVLNGDDNAGFKCAGDVFRPVHRNEAVNIFLAQLERIGALSVVHDQALAAEIAEDRVTGHRAAAVRVMH